MRNLISVLIMALAGLIAVPAAAQDARQILNTVSTLQYDHCRYMDGIYRATCQLERVTRLTDNFQANRTTVNYQRSERLERKIAMLEALSRACNAGDQQSCDRIGGGVDARRVDAARALMDACRNGDKRSCDRIESALDNGVMPTTDVRPAVRSSAKKAPTITKGMMPSDWPDRVTRDQVEPDGSNQPQRVSWTQVLIGGCLVDIDPRTGQRTSPPYDCRK